MWYYAWSWHSEVNEKGFIATVRNVVERWQNTYVISNGEVLLLLTRLPGRSIKSVRGIGFCIVIQWRRLYKGRTRMVSLQTSSSPLSLSFADPSSLLSYNSVRKGKKHLQEWWHPSKSLRKPRPMVSWPSTLAKGTLWITWTMSILLRALWLPTATTLRIEKFSAR